MEDKKELVSGMNFLIDRRIERLKKLREEENKILAKARIVINSCLILAQADGIICPKENAVIKDIFKRYCITDQVIKAYYPKNLETLSLSIIKKEIIEYKIDADFLADLKKQLGKLSIADTKLAMKEIHKLKDLQDIFEKYGAKEGTAPVSTIKEESEIKEIPDTIEEEKLISQEFPGISTEKETLITEPVFEETARTEEPTFEEETLVTEPVFEETTRIEEPTFEGKTLVTEPVFGETTGIEEPVFEEETQITEPIFEEKTQPEEQVGESQINFEKANNEEMSPAEREPEKMEQPVSPIKSPELSKDDHICFYCKKELIGLKNFCIYCGQKNPAEKIEQEKPSEQEEDRKIGNLCIACKEELLGSSPFCVHCGQKNPVEKIEQSKSSGQKENENKAGSICIACKKELLGSSPFCVHCGQRNSI